jgi:hypothetical protein
MAHARRFTREAMCARTIQVYEKLLFPTAGAESPTLVALPA